ncbi:MAG: alpha/beta fold hydrolase [Pseudonocardia sp.]
MANVMNTSNDLFPGFAEEWISIPAGRFFARVGGPEDAPPVLLLHGFPQSHLMWHAVAPALAESYRVVCLDMKGYGRSCAPAGDAAHEAYSKRTLATEAVQIMDRLGHRRFAVIGHDRGAQVAYRMALDTPEVVTHVAVLDNLPVFAVWDLINATPGTIPHWRDLARAAPVPEQESSTEYLEGLVRVHTSDRTFGCFHPTALELWRETWKEPARIHAFCEDYRAGAGPDLVADQEDLAAGKKVSCPTLILWGREFFGQLAESPVESWRQSFAPDAVGIEVEFGHFVAEENPEATLRGLRELLAR